jgi:P pilus assembly chaperone PapD
MVAPQGTERMTFTQLPATLSGDAQVHWESINDYGGWSSTRPCFVSDAVSTALLLSHS